MKFKAKGTPVLVPLSDRKVDLSVFHRATAIPDTSMAPYVK